MKRFLLWSTALIFLAGSSAYFLYTHLDSLLERVLEKVATDSAGPFLASPVDMEDVHLARDFRLSVGSLRGDWKTRDGIFRFEINHIQTEDSLLRFFQSKPIRVTFESLRPRGSSHPGVQGECVLFNDKTGTFVLNARFLELYLEEVEALDPVNLRGAEGKMTGDFHLKTDASGDQSFQMNLVSKNPGGRLQAHFFDLLTPYLPGAERAVIKTLSGLDTVRYQEAELRAGLPKPGVMKLFFHISVPDYNLNLNLNLEIRVEDNEAFFQLAELLGLIQVTT